MLQSSDFTAFPRPMVAALMDLYSLTYSNIFILYAKMLKALKRKVVQQLLMLACSIENITSIYKQYLSVLTHCEISTFRL